MAVSISCGFLHRSGASGGVWISSNAQALRHSLDDVSEIKGLRHCSPDIQSGERYRL
jgi:hypothetical protein